LSHPLCHVRPTNCCGLPGLPVGWPGRLVQPKPTSPVVAQRMRMVRTGRVQPESSCVRRLAPGEVNDECEECSTKPCADMSWDETEGVQLDLVVVEPQRGRQHRRHVLPSSVGAPHAACSPPSDGRPSADRASRRAVRWQVLPHGRRRRFVVRSGPDRSGLGDRAVRRLASETPSGTASRQNARTNVRSRAWTSRHKVPASSHRHERRASAQRRTPFAEEDDSTQR
jgi:hypothetical protein